ncbi:hypothetical protein Agub_g3960 [Astrephomene gubernaculifera]|uniref:WW domain-containing protein n=1 Tax=Astrephomene gubernaculifera TaxID=47775 RepID=A0AAD3DLH7_9CHLO|nr:hypothetical protein Agub_g3960 [Astrephomene gubernaculifera]
MVSQKIVLLAVAALLCLSSGCFAQQIYRRYVDVPGIEKDSDGQHYIQVNSGDTQTKYYVARDKESKQLYFINEETSQPQWHDPRGPALSETREVLDTPETAYVPPPNNSSVTVAIVAILPILLLAGGVAARVAYLQIHYPELLWPTKERRDRRKASGGKFKPQKQRGKMNQDGKGGRSANS